MSEPHDTPAADTSADLERLASRLAMLAGEDGEAEAAGRAVAVLARRMGLSGGHLKAIFLAGANRLGALSRQTVEQSARADRAEETAAGLRHSLDQLDFALAHAQEERDMARMQAARLQDALESNRAGRRVQLAVGLLVLVAIGSAAGYFIYGPVLTGQQQRLLAAAEKLGHGGFVRPQGADLHAAPDIASPVVAHLAGNTRVPVSEMVWHNFTQWAVIKLGDRTGYCAATDLDMD
jgi:hypothetical protein